MKKFPMVVTGVAIAALLSGCYATVATEVPPPPPPQEEVIVAAPYAGAVWVPGTWQWHRRHQRYYWRQGHWRRP